MIGLSSIVLFFLGLGFFFNGSRHLTLIILFTLASSYFELMPGFFSLGITTIQHSDFALLMIGILLPFRTGSSNKFREVKKWIVIFFAFLVVSCAYDFLFRDSSLMQIFRTVRGTFYLSFVWLLSSFKANDYLLLFKFLVIVTIGHSFLYLSQYLFDFRLTEGLAENEFGGKRVTGGHPPFLYLAVVLSLYFCKSKRSLVAILGLFVTVILFGQSRGALIGLGASLICYLYFFSKVGKGFWTWFGMASATLMTVCCLLIMFPEVSSRVGLLREESKNFNQLDFSRVETFRFKGSATFRIGLIYERFNYVSEDPIKMLFGVGFVPDKDIRVAIFKLGTESPSLPTGFEQYNSVDILFPNLITRYGFFGSAIFVILILKTYSAAFKGYRVALGKTTICYLAWMLVGSFNNETYYDCFNFLAIFSLIQCVDARVLQTQKRRRVGREYRAVIAFQKNRLQAD